ASADQHLAPSAKLRHGAHLPHLTLAGAVYAVTFRLADSLSRKIINEWNSARAQLKAAANSASAVQLAADEFDQLFAEHVEKYLNQGHGECWLRRDDVAALVEAQLQHFDG